MSAIGKAEKFLEACKANGWKGGWEFDYSDDHALVQVHRDAEKLEIEWLNNQLVAPPVYTLGGVVAKLHCASVARRVVEGQPNMEQFLKRQRRANRKLKRQAITEPSESAVGSLTAAEGTPGTPSAQNATQPVGSTDSLEVSLPFNLDEHTDKEILRMCRGGTLVWRSRYTGEAQMARIPKEKNYDLKNAYFIAESSEGRPYLSFIDSYGCFRAVAFDQMLQLR